MTEQEHLAQVNVKLLALRHSSGGAVGAYCLGFATFAHHAGYPVTPAQMRDLAECRTAAAGRSLARQFWGEDFFETRSTPKHESGRKII